MALTHNERPGHCAACAVDIEATKARLELLEQQIDDRTRRLVRLEELHGMVEGVATMAGAVAGTAGAAPMQLPDDALWVKAMEKLQTAGFPSPGRLEHIRRLLEIADEMAPGAMNQLLGPLFAKRGINPTGDTQGSNQLDTALAILAQQFKAFIVIARSDDTQDIKVLGFLERDDGNLLRQRAELAVHELLEKAADGTASHRTI